MIRLKRIEAKPYMCLNRINYIIGSTALLSVAKISQQQILIWIEIIYNNLIEKQQGLCYNCTTDNTGLITF
jgi:hypothetical protein